MNELDIHVLLLFRCQPSWLPFIPKLAWVIECVHVCVCVCVCVCKAGCFFVLGSWTILPHQVIFVLTSFHSLQWTWHLCWETLLGSSFPVSKVSLCSTAFFQLTRHLKSWPNVKIIFLPALPITQPGSKSWVLYHFRLSLPGSGSLRRWFLEQASSSLCPGGWLTPIHWLAKAYVLQPELADCKSVRSKITPTVKLLGLFLGKMVKEHRSKYLECQAAFFCPKTSSEELILFCHTVNGLWGSKLTLCRLEVPWNLIHCDSAVTHLCWTEVYFDANSEEKGFLANLMVNTREIALKANKNSFRWPFSSIVRIQTEFIH